ncbi:MAG: hypothetical protein Q3963_03745, partial [Coriobacteriaceae bacterium]|nr:hypothetical protein [Coriobacteriaceae bacterium]
MGKKETFEKITTSQFLLMQLHRRRGKELEAEFHTRREQGRVLALLKMADVQTIDDMAMVLGIEADGLTELVVALEAQGLVACERPVVEVPAEAEEAPVEEAVLDTTNEDDEFS